MPLKATSAQMRRNRGRWRSGRTAASAGLGAAAFWAACAGSAAATLGKDGASVEIDRAHMAAHLQSDARAAYTVHTLTLPNQGVVREFAARDGTIFAVAWRGQGRPDLRQLLGDNFATLQAESRPARGGRTRRPLDVSRSDLVVHSAGHPGAFWGFAYLPQRAPSGFSINDMR